ncbi:vascular endothelial growth factor receptor 1 isoform 2-T2 [Anomaloglossus baeobatrachus]
MISCAAVAMLCLMFGCLMLTGHSSGSKLKTPVLNIKAKELVVRVGQPIHLSCRGDQTVSWKFPAASRKESKRFHISDNSGQRSPDMPCNSSLTLHSAQLSDTGLYSCHYPYITTAKNPTAIYIFVSDERTAFVDTHNREPQIITITEGERLVIPCRVTSPNITVTLRQSFGNVLLSGNKNVVWDSRKGFIIRNPTYPFFDLLNCEATVNGVLQTSTYFTNKQSSAIYKVRLNVPSSIRLLRNANLTINCTVSTALNSRAEIQWTYPGLKFGKQASIIKRVVLSDSEALVYSMLIIHNVMSIDQGFYTCTAKNGPSTKTVNTTVRVHAHPYINAKPRRTGVLEAMVGQKSYRIAVKVRAFPPPEITCCDIHSGSSIPLIIGKNSSSMGNKIYSVTERTRLIEGRNKTAGILVVEDVSASGIYTCTAANKLGNERRDIHFYVTDVPNGFHITTDRLAKEGENMTLTCSVNKYLYTNISWILRRRVGNRTINHSISKHRNAITTEYSTILTVVVQNATQADSGIYECRATNTFTGDIMSESKDIIMKGEHSNRKVHLSRTSKQRRKNYSTESSTTQ